TGAQTNTRIKKPRRLPGLQVLGEIRSVPHPGTAPVEAVDQFGGNRLLKRVGIIDRMENCRTAIRKYPDSTDIRSGPVAKIGEPILRLPEQTRDQVKSVFGTTA